MDGAEPFHPAAHRNRPRFAIIAVPASKPSDTPCGTGEASRRVRVLLPFCPALQRWDQRVQGCHFGLGEHSRSWFLRAKLVPPGEAGSSGRPSRAWTSWISTHTAFVAIAASITRRSALVTWLSYNCNRCDGIHDFPGPLTWKSWMVGLLPPRRCLASVPDVKRLFPDKPLIRPGAHHAPPPNRMRMPSIATNVPGRRCAAAAPIASIVASSCPGSW